MIDTLLRPHLLPVIDSMAAKTAQSGLTANKLTLMGFALSLGGCFAVGMQAYPFGLLLLLIGRYLDALAGSIARQNGTTQTGTILDIFCDYVIFGAFAFFFTLSDTETMLASTIFIFSLMAMGMAYLAHAWVLAKKNIAEMPRGGLVENGEMIVFMIVCCLYPPLYAAVAALFALLCWTTAALRFIAAIKSSKQ